MRLTDLSQTGRTRIVVLTASGTAFCILIAFAIDGYSSGGWGANPMNNLLIPLVLAPPFFYLLLSKQRDLAIAHQELLVIASTDPLTSILNRRAFTAMVEAYLDRVDRQSANPQGALLVIDIDHFKSINDTFGHASGDAALRLVAAEIGRVVRDVDLVGRMGGEEFGVFLPGMNMDRAETVAERIRYEISSTDFTEIGCHRRVTVSVGGAVFRSEVTFDQLFKAADMRLYRAKAAGRNKVEMREPASPQLFAAA